MSENNVNYTNDSEVWESQQRDFKLLAVSVSPVLFDKNTSVFRTLCKLLRTESNTRTVLGLDVPLYVMISSVSSFIGINCMNSTD